MLEIIVSIVAVIILAITSYELGKYVSHEAGCKPKEISSRDIIKIFENSDENQNKWFTSYSLCIYYIRV